MKNYGKGFEAYELLLTKKPEDTIKAAFSSTSEETIANMQYLKKQHKRWSDFYYALDGYHQSMFDIYLDTLIK